MTVDPAKSAASARAKPEPLFPFRFAIECFSWFGLTDPSVILKVA
jgi:hypothetical protein